MDMFDHCIHVLSLLHSNGILKMWRSSGNNFKWKQNTSQVFFFLLYFTACILCFSMQKRFLCEWPPKNGSPPQGAK